MPATYPVDTALSQLRPMLDKYRDGHMSMDEITTWLANFEAEMAERDPTWEEASRRIRVLLSELESGYGNKASIHEGLDAIARDCGHAA
jgi:hypothetical protein